MAYQNPYDYFKLQDETHKFHADSAGCDIASSPLDIERENRDVVRQNLDILASNRVRSERDAARDNIKHFVQRWGLSFDENKSNYALSRDEKHIIRMDFYGSINETDKTPAHTRHTAQYLRFISSHSHDKISQQDYDLGVSPVWQLFRQFPRFRKIEGNLKKQLRKMNVPSSLLPQMNAYDFSDVLYRFYYDPDTAPKSYMFLGARRCFIKDFIRKHEKAFRRYLAQIEVDERYADELVLNMKKYGRTSHIYVVHHDKGIELLRQYQDKGLLDAHIKIGSRLSKSQIEFIRNRGDYLKIAVLGADGKPLRGPEFSVHHKVAVKDAAEVPDLLNVNMFENLCLTVDVPYHRVLHSLDVTQTIDRRESYISRIYMDKNIVFWGGFHPDFHIYYNYRQDQRTLHQKQNYALWKQNNPLIQGDSLLPENPLSPKLSRKRKKQLQKKAEIQQRKAVAMVCSLESSLPKKKKQEVSNEKKLPAVLVEFPLAKVNNIKTVIAKAREEKKKKLEQRRKCYRKKVLTKKKKEALGDLMGVLQTAFQKDVSAAQKEKAFNRILVFLNKKRVR